MNNQWMLPLALLDGTAVTAWAVDTGVVIASDAVDSGINSDTERMAFSTIRVGILLLGIAHVPSRGLCQVSAPAVE